MDDWLYGLGYGWRFLVIRLEKMRNESLDNGTQNNVRFLYLR